MMIDSYRNNNKIKESFSVYFYNGTRKKNDLVLDLLE